MTARFPIVIAGVLLSLFSVAGAGLVAVTHVATADRIAQNERQALLDRLAVLVPAERVTNDMAADALLVSDRERLGADRTTVYRARAGDAPVALILTAVVPDGYAGPINLLVAVLADGTLGGVRVITHKETPGLGDKIEEQRTDWIHGFSGKSLADPEPARWKVKRDGGDFDQFTGATVTPRAVVKAVKNTLLYVKEKGNALYAPADSVQARALLGSTG
jgi:Na+-translocating ferredoxin:NAD+ oxidoreductase subunit G